MISILDACAMIAYLQGNPGGTVVDAILTDPDSVVYAHSINLCEVYYHFLRLSDEETAEQAIDDLLACGVIERQDMSRALWKRVGNYKQRGRISLADCFCLALTEQLAGRLVTSDHGEFDPIVSLGICEILFIR